MFKNVAIQTMYIMMIGPGPLELRETFPKASTSPPNKRLINDGNAISPVALPITKTVMCFPCTGKTVSAYAMPVGKTHAMKKP